jgi:nickel-type superoxide dismutase maturation protease
VADTARRVRRLVRAVRRLVARLDTARVAGRSMSPRIRDGDLLLVLREAPARPGDVVVCRRPDRPDLLVVKRAVTRLTTGWWVAGDNPAASDDSRDFGVVPDDLVVARVLLRYWPPRRRPGGRPG